jgi:uncharacterized membrane protein YdbT with pleckstrin-like domain
MSYTESHLLPDERIKYQTHLHWFPFLPAYLLASLFVVAGFAGLVAEATWLAIAGFGIAIPIFIWLYITRTTSEFSVTDRRVIIKVGFIRRRTLETMLGKVETIGVEQSLIGRLFDFGTIVVMGTGGTKEPFRNIADPLEFRRQVQTEISNADDEDDGERAVARVDSVPALAHPEKTRDERECPYCAELILKKARVCKHCDREVQPLSA